MKSWGVLVLVLVFSLIPFAFAQEGRLAPTTNINLYQENDYIVVGQITELDTSLSMSSTQYTVKIIKSLKGYTFDGMMTVIGGGNAESGQMRSIDKIFEKDSTVLFFINEREGTLELSPYSRSVEPNLELLLFSISPLKLHNLGVPNNEIFCNFDRILVEKYDNTPACVKSSSIEKLEQRGWIGSVL